MSSSTSTYAVGYGRPPLHTRFQKGQSGNPSGKPGPAKLAKQRFERALFAALEGSEAELEQSMPDRLVATVARRIALDAAAGRIPSVKLLLTLLDAGCKQADAEEAAARQEEEALSLVQGIAQGNDAKCLEDVLWPDLRDWVLKESRSREAAAEVPARNEGKPVSLVQGKTQRNGKCQVQFSGNFGGTEFSEAEYNYLHPAGRSKFAKRISGGDTVWPASPHPKNAEARFSTPAFAGAGSYPQGGGNTGPLSLVQGKTQGNNKLSAEKIRAVPEWEKAPVVMDKRTLLMTSAGVSLPPGRQNSGPDKEAWRLRA